MLMRIASPTILLVLSAYLYGTDLGVGSLKPEELQLTFASKAIATSGGHDADGRFLPLFVHVSGEKWLAPIPVYANVLLMKVFPSSAQVRWAAAITGSLSVLLVYGIAVIVFRSPGLALVAGLMVLLSPAHVTYSRLASADGIWQVPFVAVWLLGLIGFVDGSFFPRWMLAMSVASLAATIYSQPSAGVMIPWLALATIAAMRRAPHRKWGDLALACGTFACVLLPLVLWFARHPSTYPDTLGAWTIHKAHIRNPADWLRAWTNIQTLSLCANAFWGFFSPSHLFLKAGASAPAPVFLFPTGILVICGVVEVVRAWGEEKAPGIAIVHQVGLFGFIIGPLAAATFKEPTAIQRALVIVPFGALLAVVGVLALWTRSRPVFLRSWDAHVARRRAVTALSR
jgi:hypothetical protein